MKTILLGTILLLLVYLLKRIDKMKTKEFIDVAIQHVIEHAKRCETDETKKAELKAETDKTENVQQRRERAWQKKTTRIISSRM